MKTTRALEFDF